MTDSNNSQIDSEKTEQQTKPPPIKFEKNDVQSTNKESKPIEFWLSVANLIITFFGGIILVSIFNYRNEQLQKEIITLQVEAGRDITQANFNSYVFCVEIVTCDGAVRFYNHGPAPAQNVQITIFLNSVNSSWSEEIKDITQFPIQIFPPSLSYSIEALNRDHRFFEADFEGKNTYVIFFEFIPPDSFVDVVLDYKPYDFIDTFQVTQEITIYQPSNVNIALSHDFDHFLNSKYPLAGFNASLVCNNCPNLETNKVVVAMMEMNSMQMIKKKNGGITYDVVMSAIVPEGKKTNFDLKPMYIEAFKEDEQSGVAIKELLEPKDKYIFAITIQHMRLEFCQYLKQAKLWSVGSAMRPSYPAGSWE